LTRQLTHLVSLVDDLLDVSRISHGKILLQKGVFDLVAVVSAAVKDYRLLLESSGLRIDLALPPVPLPIEGDRARIAYRPSVSRPPRRW
jgi:signal transduction histidine kinase